MAQFNPIPTTHPSIIGNTWTKVNTVIGRDRHYIALANESTGYFYRFECVSLDSYTSGFTSGSGKILAPAANANHIGGIYEETYDNLSTGDIYVYANSGSTGAVTTLAVTEGT